MDTQKFREQAQAAHDQYIRDVQDAQAHYDAELKQALERFYVSARAIDADIQAAELAQAAPLPAPETTRQLANS